jgi:uncharacterized membrane protein
MAFLGFLLFLGLIYVVVSALKSNPVKQNDSSVDLRSLRQRVEVLDDKVRQLSIQVHALQGEQNALTPKQMPAAAPVIPMRLCLTCHAPVEKDVNLCDSCEATLNTPPAEKPKTAVPPATPIVVPPMIWPPVTPAAPIRPPVPASAAAFKIPAAAHFTAPKRVSPPIDWESFLGVKLFAWLGGFALFLGMAFFVKYSLDHNLISPLMRIVTGGLVGIGCIGGGLNIRRKDLAVTVQTLCAAGVAVLYADVYAARSLYEFLSPSVAFAAMSFVTGLAFFLSVRLDSKFVAILGWVGGFLTSPMLSTGVDRPLALFGYVAVLDLGIAAVVFKKKWGFLMSLGAAATLAMEAGWIHKFLTPEKAAFAMGLYLVFGLFYAIVSDLSRRRGDGGLWATAPGAFVPLVSMGFVAQLLTFESVQAHPLLPLALLLALTGLGAYAAIRGKEPFIAFLGLTGAFVIPLLLTTQVNRPVMLFGYTAVLAVLAAFVAIRQRWGFVLALSAVGSFAMEVCWTVNHLAPEKALFAMGLYAAFAVFYMAVAEMGGLWHDDDLAFTAPGVLYPIVSMGFVAHLLDWPPLAGTLIHPLILLVILSGLTLYAAIRRGEVGVALFGLAIAFILPVVSPVLDHTLLYFAFGGLLTLAMVVVGLKQRWGSLIGEAAIGLVSMSAVWTASKFHAEQAPHLSAWVLGVSVFFLIIREIAERRQMRDHFAQGPASLVPLFGMGAVGVMLSMPELAGRPGLVLGLLLALGVQLAYIAVPREEARPVYIFGGLLSFCLLALWTTAHLKQETLLWGLGFYLAFGVVHTVFPFLLQMVRPAQKPFTWGYAAPILMLVLILIAMGSFTSLLLWLFVGLLAMLALGAAYLAGSLIASGIAVVLVMVCFAVGITNVPVTADADALLLLLGLFGSGFFLWGLLITGSAFASLKSRFSAGWDVDADSLKQFPALAAILPFLLLGMVCLRLPLPQPFLVFSVMVLMTVMLLVLAAWRGLEVLVPIALGSVLTVLVLWHERNTTVATAIGGLWDLGFYAGFSLFPFLVRKRLTGKFAWITSAVAGLGFFPLLHAVFIQLWGKGAIGLLPAGLAMAPLLGLGALSQILPATDARRSTLLAYFGGVGLFFLTLIIPLQFDKEVLTLGWALEGAALLWLYRRIAHDGLKTWGVSLLLISFARLALNPAVLSYHARTNVPFMNWYLYVYGLSAAALFLAAQALPKDRRFLWDTDMPPLLNSLGGILLFLLMNIEIADFFSSGTAITFNFSGNIAQDMTYSIGWGLFAIGTLIAGIRANSKGARYASLALLIVTIFKVFLHDLWRLCGLFRVGSFIGLAVGLMLVSYLYQRFLSKEKDHA